MPEELCQGPLGPSIHGKACAAAACPDLAFGLRTAKWLPINLIREVQLTPGQRVSRLDRIDQHLGAGTRSITKVVSLPLPCRVRSDALETRAPARAAATRSAGAASASGARPAKSRVVPGAASPGNRQDWRLPERLFGGDDLGDADGGPLGYGKLFHPGKVGTSAAELKPFAAGCKPLPCMTSLLTQCSRRSAAAGSIRSRRRQRGRPTSATATASSTVRRSGSCNTRPRFSSITRATSTAPA